MADTDDIQERIRRRAHELWEREGHPHGRESEHWAQAEAEIRGAGVPEPAEKVAGSRRKATAKTAPDKAGAEKAGPGKTTGKTTRAAAESLSEVDKAAPPSTRKGGSKAESTKTESVKAERGKAETAQTGKTTGKSTGKTAEKAPAAKPARGSKKDSGKSASAG
ncbi:DUF2934 domain-containing protein [Azospirillum sp. TSO35-2]|uniref:DUF2934 domain-containing protein n=1 Tax=Azospirillum sp. TSO35-2 TaxID=716796 RepID=UPI000D6134BB|nr:DUF2934 domain-containing protein [Azospirillum sp. TSO35-2]PWC37500.1 hypothetical protein TSO352_08085 [Azospirillum sp. TSO35-2]